MCDSHCNIWAYRWPFCIIELPFISRCDDYWLATVSPSNHNFHYISAKDCREADEILWHVWCNGGDTLVLVFAPKQQNTNHFYTSDDPYDDVTPKCSCAIYSTTIIPFCWPPINTANTANSTLYGKRATTWPNHVVWTTEMGSNFFSGTTHWIERLSSKQEVHTLFWLGVCCLLLPKTNKGLGHTYYIQLDEMTKIVLYLKR